VLTLFATAKPFRGHNAIIQRNALQSWKALHPEVEIILFGDDEGAAEAAREFGLRHEPHVERNEWGTKRLDYLFARAQAIAQHEILCYINCDIILMGDFRRALERVRAMHRQFLMVGRRWDTDITGPLPFRERQPPDWRASISPARERDLCSIPRVGRDESADSQSKERHLRSIPRIRRDEPPHEESQARHCSSIQQVRRDESSHWEEELRSLVLRHGRRRTAEWIDYFAFTRGLYGPDMPPFVLRVFWDNWLAWKALDSGKPVVDASRAVMAVHQNHDYSYHPQGKAGVWSGEEAGLNAQLAGGWRHFRTIADATEILPPEKPRRAIADVMGALPPEKLERSFTGATEPLLAEKAKPNVFRHLSAAKRHLRQAGRVLFYDVWHPVWFAFLNLTRPLRRSLRHSLRSSSRN
jgi:hypothetical protein